MEALGNFSKKTLMDELGAFVVAAFDPGGFMQRMSDIDEMIAWAEKRHAERDGMKKYITTTDIDLLSLAETGIDPAIFLELFRSEEDICASKGNVINEDSTLYAFRSELLRIGMIKEDVCDPVVRKGDKFINNGFRLVLFGDDNHRYCFIEIMYGSQQTDWVEVEDKDMIRLSEIVGVVNLNDFKPSKIKITEAE